MDAQFNIRVKHMTNKPLELQVTKENTVLEIKGKIAEGFGVPAEDQKLIFKGKILDNSLTASDLGMEEGDTLHMVSKTQMDRILIF